MHPTQLNNQPRTYALIHQVGDEPMSEIGRFCDREQVTAASFTAIGAFQRVTLAYFDWETKEYEEIPLDEQVEVLSLAGNVAMHDQEPKVHAHVVVGRRDGTVRGGHLMEGVVRPTLEVVLTEAPSYLRREMDDETGLPLIAGVRA